MCDRTIVTRNMFHLHLFVMENKILNFMLLFVVSEYISVNLKQKHVPLIKWCIIEKLEMFIITFKVAKLTVIYHNYSKYK